MELMYPRHLKPGGWVEFQDIVAQVFSDDDSLVDSTLPLFLQKMGESLAAFGMKYFLTANNLGQYLEDAGFANIRLKTIKIPVGTWPKVRVLKSSAK
jgi:hypothetical protein